MSSFTRIESGEKRTSPAGFRFVILQSEVILVLIIKPDFTFANTFVLI